MRSLLTALVLLAVPATAAADPTNLGGVKTNDVDVAMTSDGAAHVARLAQASNVDPFRVVVCRIPAGGTTCTQTADLALPNTDGTEGPWILTDGTKVVVVVGNSNGASNGTGQRTFASVSADGTASYSAFAKVAPIRPIDVELSPAKDRLWITSSTGPSGTSNDYLAFASAPLPPGNTPNSVVLNTVSGGRSVDGQVLGITPEGKPLAFLDGEAPDLTPAGNFYRPFTGAATDAELNDASKWGAPVRYELPDPFQRNGRKDVTSENGKLWLAYNGLGRDSVLRQYTGGSFAAPVTPDCTNQRFGAGLQEAPHVAITRTGDLLIAEVGSDGDNQHLGFFHGNSGGTAFSPYQELSAAPRIQGVEVAADPTSDTGGVAVWTSDSIYIDKGEVFFVRLPTAATAACPVATASPTPSPTTTATPVPTVTPTTGGPTKTVSSSVGGATLKLTLPNRCVAAGAKFKVKLALKKPKKAKLKKIVKVVFSATGNKARKDRKVPYSATFKVPAGAKRVTIKAKVTVKFKKQRKKVTKTVKGSFAVC